MKRKLTFILTAFLLSAAFTLMSCGNDDEINNMAFITPDGKVDVTRAVEFRVNFGDYTSEEELQGTRAAKTEGSDTLSRQYVELDNGLLAEVTVQKDMAKVQTNKQHPVTRALDDDTYTMLAYKDGVLKGEMTGVVSNGKFTATGSNGYIHLATGIYDFVLFNSKVTRNDDSLTVNLSNAGTALIGRTRYTVTTEKNQAVTFTMNHAGSRMRIKLTGYTYIMEGTAATLSSVAATSVPNTAVYNAATGTWSNGAGAATIGNLTFPESKESMYSSSTASFTSQSNEYMYLLPLTNPSKLRLTFTGGTIYNKDLKGAEVNLSVPTLASMAANGSYIINVKLMYNFLYLMSDGTTGPTKATTYGGGTKTPIGVVVSRGNRLAIALKDANSGSPAYWYNGIGYQQKNYRKFEDNQEESSNADMDGYKYTWEASGSADGKTIKANKKFDFPAFYHAGNYGNELAAELAAQGKALSDGMKIKKWHLPSKGEWIFVSTTFGDIDRTGITFNWAFNYDMLVYAAFIQVGGKIIILTEYWSSTESTNGRAYYTLSSFSIPLWVIYGQRTMYSVRSFIKY